MAACKKCGAEASAIACDFCGAIQTPPSNLQEEFVALDAISKAAQNLAQNGVEGRLDEYWKSAWLPSYPDSIVQAATIALAGVAPGMDLDGHEEDLNQALIARARGALRALELRGPGDPRIATLRRQVDEVTEATNKASRNGLLLRWGLKAAPVVGVILLCAGWKACH